MTRTLASAACEYENVWYCLVLDRNRPGHCGDGDDDRVLATHVESRPQFIAFSPLWLFASRGQSRRQRWHSLPDRL